jgi:MFS transporter, AAHS family, cis,cis-muconate transporter
MLKISRFYCEHAFAASSLSSGPLGTAAVRLLRREQLDADVLEKELHLEFSSMTGYMVGTYVAMILGKIVAGWLADKFSHRAVFAFGAAMFLPVIVLYNSPGNIAYLMTIFGFLSGIPYGVNATYMTESFETRIRGSAVGGAYNIGRIGAQVHR